MPHVLRREVRIAVGDRAVVTGVLTRRSGPSGPAVVLGHGAGGNLHTPAVAAIAHGLATRDVPTLRYNFPFSEAGRRRPDFPRFLQATTKAAADALVVRLSPPSVVLAGKSLGGRMSSHVVADQGYPAAGLVFFGYPLHPPRREEELRDSHLARVSCPMLFIEGTRDPFANLDILRPLLDKLRASGRRADLHVVEGADHDFRVPVRMKRSYESVLDEVVEVASTWIATLPGPNTLPGA